LWEKGDRGQPRVGLQELEQTGDHAKPMNIEHVVEAA
jgi:hypothetical protein